MNSNERNMTEDGIIISSRLLLRKVRYTDEAQVFDIFSNQQVTEHYDCHTFTAQIEAHKWLQWNQALYKQKGLGGFRWAITLIEDPCIMIGSCGIHTLNPQFHSLEIGYELHPDYWGQGIMTEALKVMIQMCFDENFPIILNRITAITHLQNNASINVLNKLGFQEEGVLREYGFWKEEYHTVRLFSLLKHDWLIPTIE